MGKTASGLGRILRKGTPVRSSLEFFNNLTAILTLIGPIIYWALGIETPDVILDLPDASLPFRLFGLVAAVAVLGYGLGAAIAWLTRRNTTATVVAAGVVTIAWALLLVGAADGLARSGTGGAVPEFTLFLLVGLGLMLWLLTFQMRAQADAGNAVIVQDRALMIVLFTATALAAGLLVSIGGAS